MLTQPVHQQALPVLPGIDEQLNELANPTAVYCL